MTALHLKMRIDVTAIDVAVNEIKALAAKRVLTDKIRGELSALLDPTEADKAENGSWIDLHIPKNFLSETYVAEPSRRLLALVAGIRACEHKH